METNYYKRYSPSLGRDMEFKCYGFAGKPVLFIPCQNGRFYDFENFHMSDVLAPWINSGKIMVCSIDTLDNETWSETSGNPRQRMERHEQWITYLINEIVPFLQEEVRNRNHWEGNPSLLIFGCSLGAAHAANLYLRRPDLFDRLLALSGVYSTEYGFGNYMDDLVYRNSPVHYMDHLPQDHPYRELFRKGKAIFCTGQGPWEIPDYTRQLETVLGRQKIPAWFDYWGYDCSHDWCWWHRQAAYFMPYLLDEK